MKLKIATMTAAALLASAWTASAAFVNYTVDGVAAQQFPGSVTPPANAPWGVNGYPGDTVALQSHNGTLDLTPGSYVQKINTLLWTIDYTYGGTATDPDAWSDLNFVVNAIRNMSIDGVGPVALNQVGSLDVTWENDFLGFSSGSTVTFLVQGYKVDVTPLGLAQVGGSNFAGSNPWAQPSRDMMAEFVVTLDATAVPEPSTYLAGALLLLPFGAKTIRILRKKRTV